MVSGRETRPISLCAPRVRAGCDLVRHGVCDNRQNLVVAAASPEIDDTNKICEDAPAA